MPRTKKYLKKREVWEILARLPEDQRTVDGARAEALTRYGDTKGIRESFDRFVEGFDSKNNIKVLGDGTYSIAPIVIKTYPPKNGSNFLTERAMKSAALFMVKATFDENDMAHFYHTKMGVSVSPTDVKSKLNQYGNVFEQTQRGYRLKAVEILAGSFIEVVQPLELEMLAERNRRKFRL